MTTEYKPSPKICFCIGPQKGERYCPCQLQVRENILNEIFKGAETKEGLYSLFKNGKK